MITVMKSVSYWTILDMENKEHYFWQALIFSGKTCDTIFFNDLFEPLIPIMLKYFIRKNS